MGADGLLGQTPVHIHLAAQNLRRIQLAQHDVGISDTGQLTASHIAGRARGGSGTAGAHFQCATLVDVGNGTAAGAHGDDVDHGDAGGIALHRAVVGQLSLAVFDQAHIDTGAAHVKGDDLVQSHLLADVNGTDHTGRRTGHRRLNGTVYRLCNGDDRAVGLGDIGSHPNARLLDGTLEVVDVLLHHRPQIGIEHGGTHAGVLPELGYQIVRGGDVYAGILLLNDLLDPVFMSGIDEGEQGTHCNGLCTHGLQAAHRISHAVLI